MTLPDIQNAAAPGLARRLAAIFYDAWLVAGLWLLGVIIDTVARDPNGLGIAMSHLPLQLYTVSVPFLFFGWFWTHGGKTLGMQAWRLRVVDLEGRALDWRRAVIRVAAAYLSALAFGLGYLWLLIDPDRRTWHDRLSGTRLVLVKRD